MKVRFVSPELECVRNYDTVIYVKTSRRQGQRKGSLAAVATIMILCNNIVRCLAANTTSRFCSSGLNHPYPFVSLQPICSPTRWNNISKLLDGFGLLELNIWFENRYLQASRQNACHRKQWNILTDDRLGSSSRVTTEQLPKRLRYP